METFTVIYKLKKNNKVIEKKVSFEKWNTFYAKAWNKIELLEIIA